jgi:hypothetical protein
MKRFPAAFLAAALGLAGCGGSEIHPETDVVQPSGFTLRTAPGIEKSEGVLRRGTLEYSGYGDLVETFQEYLADMRGMDWACTAEDVSQVKSAATLKKGTRTCQVTFTKIGESIKAVITMLPAK